MISEVHIAPGVASGGARGAYGKDMLTGAERSNFRKRVR